MENRKILIQEQKKRLWRGFWIGSATGAIVSVVACCCLIFAGLFGAYFVMNLFFTVSWPAKMICSIWVENFYAELGIWNSIFLVILTNTILLGLIGVVCSLFLRRSKDSIDRPTG